MGKVQKMILFVLAVAAIVLVVTTVKLDGQRAHNIEEYALQNETASDYINSYCKEVYDGTALVSEIKKNEVIYTYQYKEPIEERIMNELKSQMGIFGDSMEDAYNRMMKTLLKESGFSKMKVTLRFLDSEDDVLYEREYKMKI